MTHPKHTCPNCGGECDERARRCRNCVPAATRECVRCHRELSLDAFERYYVKGQPHGWRPNCRECREQALRRHVALPNPVDPTGASVLVALTMGQFAIIDAVDAERVLKHKWSALKSPHTFYAVRMNEQGKSVLLHRFILNVSAEVEVDHVDLNGLNCRRSNLRAATSAENKRNRLINKASSNPYKGVVFCKDSGRWAARISIGNRNQSLGRYDTPEEAAHVYDDALRLIAGSFGRYNFPNDEELSALS